MKTRLLAIASSAITSLVLAGNAQALLVAGWDHSQYLGDALLSIDGATFTDTLGANYSSLDPTGLGPDSAAYGTLYLDGQFGSTNVGAGSGTEPFLPSAAVGGSLSSNIDAPVQDGFLNPFDTFTVLTAEGQTFANALAMTAIGAVSVVYAADAGLPGIDWSISFGGRTQNGAATVGLEFSADGVNYASLGSFNLTTTDTPYSAALPGLADRGYFRFVFSSDAVTAPVIDNVAISVGSIVPEPGTAMLLLTGLAGLTAQGRRRRA
jgi:hypothetical protein